MPSLTVDVVSGAEKAEFLADAAQILSPEKQLKLRQQGQYSLLNSPDLVAVRVVYLQTVSPGQLAFHHIKGLPCLVVNIIAVEPGKQPLFEQ